MVTKTARSRKNERDLIWVSSEIALVTDVRQTVTLEIRVCQTARQFPAYPSLPADHQPYPEAEQNAYFNLHLQSSSKNGSREDAKTRRFQRCALPLFTSSRETLNSKPREVPSNGNSCRHVLTRRSGLDHALAQRL